MGGACVKARPQLGIAAANRPPAVHDEASSETRHQVGPVVPPEAKSRSTARRNQPYSIRDVSYYSKARDGTRESKRCRLLRSHLSGCAEKGLPFDPGQESTQKVGVVLGLADDDVGHVLEDEGEVVRRAALDMAREEVVGDEADHGGRDRAVVFEKSKRTEKKG